MRESAEGFEVFTAVVDAGSISAASRALGEPRETLSRRLGRLEQRLGVRLLHRSSRRLTLTPAGQTLYERASRLVLAAREAERAVRHLDDRPRGLLRISLPPGGAQLQLDDMLIDYLRRWPEVRLEVLETGRYVDLVAEGVDVAMRGGPLRDANLIARRLWRSDLVAVASPGYLDRRGRPAVADDLTEHDCIIGMAGGERPEATWPLRDGGRVRVGGRLTTSDPNTRVRAAIAGFGIALVPRPIAAVRARPGELEHVLEGVVGTAISMALVYVERDFMPPKVRAFIDHVTRWFKQRDPVGRALREQAAGSIVPP